MIAVQLTANARRALAAAGSLETTIGALSRDRAGVAAQSSRTLTLRQGVPSLNR